MIEPLCTVDHKVGAPALFRIRYLLGHKGEKLLVGHARPLEGAPPLYLGGCRDHDDGVTTAVATSLEQERDIEDHDGVAADLRGGEKFFPHGGDQRVDDGLEPR